MLVKASESESHCVSIKFKKVPVLNLILIDCNEQGPSVTSPLSSVCVCVCDNFIAPCVLP